jgi:hypothetical protein
MSSEEALFNKLRRIPYKKMDALLFLEYADNQYGMFFKDYMNSMSYTEAGKRRDALLDKHGWTLKDYISDDRSKWVREGMSRYRS